MKTVKNTLVLCSGLVILLFGGCSSSNNTPPIGGCGSNSSSLGIPAPTYRNQIVIYNIPLQKEGDPIKIIATPLDKISKGTSYFKELEQKEGLSATIWGYLYPYDFKTPNSNDIEIVQYSTLGKERKFNFELYVANKLILQKIITVKSEKKPNKAPWCLKTDKLEVDNMDYVKILGKDIYIDFKKEFRL